MSVKHELVLELCGYSVVIMILMLFISMSVHNIVYIKAAHLLGVVYNVVTC